METFKILPELIIGEAPLTKEDIENLKKNYNITAILCLQTDEDFKSMGSSYNVLWNMSMKDNILPERHPIEDMNPSDLLRKLPEVLEKLHNLIKSGHKVYLHCTAGVNRSPTVTAAYLVKFKGLSLKNAIEIISKKKHVIIFEDTLWQWYEKQML